MSEKIYEINEMNYSNRECCLSGFIINTGSELQWGRTLKHFHIRLIEEEQM
jgi:hypothetical protein